MNQLQGMLGQFAQVAIVIGIIAVGFGIMLKGMAPKSATPIIRFGAFLAGGALILLFVATS